MPEPIFMELDFKKIPNDALSRIVENSFHF
jgi:hypothetical protein